MKNEKVAKGRIIGLAGPCSFSFSPIIFPSPSLSSHFSSRSPSSQPSAAALGLSLTLFMSHSIYRISVCVHIWIKKALASLLLFIFAHYFSSLIFTGIITGIILAPLLMLYPYI